MTDGVDSLHAKARRTLAEAEHLFESDFYEGSISRAYYAMFHAAEAALLDMGITTSTHKGVHMMFGKHFVKTERLPAHLGRDLTAVFEARQAADYGDMQGASNGAGEVLQKARSFVDHIERYLRERS
jgi:hypothetical protein